MIEKPVYLTPEGKTKLEEELEFLRLVKRPQVAERINQAKGYGDIMESGEYDDAKNEQGFVEGRIRTIETILSNARLIAEHQPHGVVELGSRVTLRGADGEEETWTIVSSAEVSSREGKISDESPVGAALIGRRVGDTVIVEVPAGPLEFAVVKVE